jgi:hypothetical protein
VLLKKDSKASSPPAEAPIPTIGKPRDFEGESGYSKVGFDLFLEIATFFLVFGIRSFSFPPPTARLLLFVVFPLDLTFFLGGMMLC